MTWPSEKSPRHPENRLRKSPSRVQNNFDDSGLRFFRDGHQYTTVNTAALSGPHYKQSVLGGLILLRGLVCIMPNGDIIMNFLFSAVSNICPSATYPLHANLLHPNEYWFLTIDSVTQIKGDPTSRSFLLGNKFLTTVEYSLQTTDISPPAVSSILPPSNVCQTTCVYALG